MLKLRIDATARIFEAVIYKPALAAAFIAIGHFLQFVVAIDHFSPRL
jgi:hypothetical protein